jgi:glutathione synthase/RimK-type ligase-like ATP-grasp enzyme
MKQRQSGPLIGIMTAKRANGSIAGNGRLFTSMQKKLISLDGISFVFTLDGVGEDSINGYTFLPDENRWIKNLFPFPDLVYNRIPFRKSEQSEECQRFFSRLKEKKIPFFNPCFIDKHELYDLFKNHPVLKSYLPETIPVSQKKDLFLFFTTHSSIYLKPAKSSQGKGIFRLKQTFSQIQLEGIKYQETFPSFEHFWETWGNTLLQKDYLAQQSIDTEEYEGYRFDFRILAHGKGDGYVLTGIGIRQSQEQEITTHIPSGGRLLPYERIQTNAHDHFIHTVVPQIGNAMSERFGYFGEFSIDAGVSKTGYYYIYEVNSKPMSFDEPEIEARKLEQLCRLFLQLSNFPRK